MLVGTSWRITGIRVDTTEAERPVMYPSALVTGLYSRHHGDRLLNYDVSNAHYYAQPLQLGNIAPAPRVAEQDVVITADADAYYLHILNRAYDEARELRFVLPERVQPTYRQYVLSGTGTGARSPYAAVEKRVHRGAGKRTVVTVPARSVSVVVIDR